MTTQTTIEAKKLAKREYYRLYRMKNKEKLAARARAYYAANREKILARAAIYRANKKLAAADQLKNVFGFNPSIESQIRGMINKHSGNNPIISEGDIAAVLFFAQATFGSAHNFPEAAKALTAGESTTLYCNDEFIRLRWDSTKTTLELASETTDFMPVYVHKLDLKTNGFNVINNAHNIYVTADQKSVFCVPQDSQIAAFLKAAKGLGQAKVSLGAILLCSSFFIGKNLKTPNFVGSQAYQQLNEAIAECAGVKAKSLISKGHLEAKEETLRIVREEALEKPKANRESALAKRQREELEGRAEFYASLGMDIHGNELSAEELAEMNAQIAELNGDEDNNEVAA